MRKATYKNWQRGTAAAAALALCAGVLTGCGASSSTAASSAAASSAAASEVSSEEADEMAANNVADVIDAIYVQERNENTDALCEAAKAAWDALTDAQKELLDLNWPGILREAEAICGAPAGEADELITAGVTTDFENMALTEVPDKLVTVNTVLTGKAG